MTDWKFGEMIRMPRPPGEGRLLMFIDSQSSYPGSGHWIVIWDDSSPEYRYDSGYIGSWPLDIDDRGWERLDD